MYEEIMDKYRNKSIMNDIEHKNFQITEIGEPTLGDTFEYTDARITKMQNNVITKRLNELQYEKIVKDRYSNDLKVLDLLKFLTRADT